MKYINFTALYLCVILIPCVADAQEDKISFTSSFDAVSEYVFRGTSLGQYSLQPSSEVTTNFGLTAGAWFSAGLGDASSVQTDEIDIYANYKVPLKSALSVDVGGTYYYYPQLGTPLNTEGGTAGSYEIYGSVGLDDVTLSPAATVYYDLTLEALTVEGSIGHSLPLPRDGWTADLGLTVGHVEFDEGTGYEWGTATLSLNKAITDNLSFYISGNFTHNTEDKSLGFGRESLRIGTDVATRDKDSLYWLGTGLSVSY